MITAAPDLLPSKLTICGIAELDRFCAVGVTHVLSILDPAAEDPPAFGSFGEHARTVLRFHDVIAEWPGYQAPQEEDIRNLLAFGESLVATPAAHLLVHCHMGISRSTAAMAILLAQGRPGVERAAFAALTRVRPRCWPNSRMIAIADALLVRGGALTAALKGHQAALLREHPDLADLVRSVGRGHELPAEAGSA